MTWRQRVLGLKFGRWCVGVALASVVLKSLIPAGFMPVFSSNVGDGLTLVICTANGAKVVSTDGHDEKPSKKGHSDQPCVFSGIAQVALLEADARVIAPSSFSKPTTWILVAFSLPPVRAGPQLGTRGPPSLV